MRQSDARFKRFIGEYADDIMVGSVMVAGVGGIVLAGFALETPTDSEAHKLSEKCFETEYVNYSGLTTELPDKLIVTKQGEIISGDSKVNVGTEQLHFAGLDGLTQSRENMHKASNISDLQFQATNAFAPLDLRVLFDSNQDFPSRIVSYYEDETFTDLLPKEKDLDALKYTLDALLIAETFRPDEFRQQGKRDSVVIVAQWGNPGQAFTIEDNEGEKSTHFVTRIGQTRIDNADTNAHEAGHNIAEGLCQTTYRGDAVTALSRQDDKYDPEEKAYVEKKNGRIKYDHTRFVTWYAATDGPIEEWAEISKLLYIHGYPEPQNLLDATIVDRKISATAQMHELYIPGSLEYFVALGVGKLCFDVVLDKTLYPGHTLPERKLACRPR